MPREYGRYLASTHDDRDWHALTTTQHDCYMTLLSSPDITYAGEVPYLPGRFASLAADLTANKVEKAWTQLAAHRFIVIDQATSEILLRTFVRHDGVLTGPVNLTKAFVNAYGRVRSEALREVIAQELRKYRADAPTLRNWPLVDELLPGVAAP